VFLIGLIVGQFTSGLAAQASASRLMFAMGRDGVLPRALLGTLSPRFGTPVGAILVCAVVALLALKLDVTTSTSFINFGAFLAFSLVNLSVIVHFARQPQARGPLQLLLYLLCPLIGLLATLWLMASLDRLAIMLGCAWLVFGGLYLTWLTGGFRRQPPQLQFGVE